MWHAELPDRIGPYRVMDRLGEGGMGTVYAGTDDSGRKVAIKVIRREYAADPQYRARFESEVRAAQRVRPFCTAPVLDADPRADPPYLVTEFVNGQSLAAAIGDGGPLRGADLEAVAVGIATALTAIHDAGVVHRDLKPANVLLSTFGPRVIDFGIARSLDGPRLTATGGIVGTPAFMAPEQLNGRGASPASDVWAWGATVAFAARGETCFAGNSLPSIIHQIMSAEPDLGGLDGSLLRAVGRALAKDPAHRPTAQELLDGLISSGVREHPAEERHRTQAPPRPDTNPPFQPDTNRQHPSARPDDHGPSRPGTYPPPQPGTRPPAHGTAPAAAGPALAAGEAEALVERQYRQAAQAGDPAAMRNLAALLGGQGRTAEADSWSRYADSVATRPASYGHHAPPAGQRAKPHMKPPLNSYAIYALTFGLVGLVTCGLPSIPAIVAGHLAWSRVRRSGERGLGLALTGIALGWIMVAIWLLLFISMVAPPADES